jgi:hypothetical protein
MDELKPGREMDALVAERVFGWKRLRNQVGWYRDGDKSTWNMREPRFSTDISAAWTIVEKLKGMEPEIEWSDEIHAWCVVFYKSKIDSATLGDTAPLAICKAALKAVGER